MSLKKSKRKKAKSQKKKRPKKNQHKSVWAIGGVAAGILAVVALLYVVYLDTVIRMKFEGKRWSLPARVYARPLELYPGGEIGKAELLQELKFLNYRPGESLPGTYQERGNAVTLNTRGFTFWDSVEVPQRLMITFMNQRVHEILDFSTSESLQLLRLEPPQIASIYPAHKEDRDLVRLQDVPAQLRRGLIAVEDHEFYQHAGVKPSSILRALVANIRAGATVQGGSTLTQQLVKNFFLSNERTIRRKAVEAVMALLLEWHYDKDEILEAYLNEVYLGQQGERAIHGFGLASRVYFDRPLQELNTEQLALLIGMVKGASYYNPVRNPDRATQRRNLVLNIMTQEGLLNSAEVQTARMAPLGVRPEFDYSPFSYPAFVGLVKRQLSQQYRDEDLRTEGLRIFTTFDPQVQQAAEEALTSQLQALAKAGRESLEGAVVVSSTDSGEVLAVVGGGDPRFAGYNRALDARRPIGSLVKPAVYMTALQHPALFTPATLIEDTELAIEYPPGQQWQPQNYDETFHGSIPLVQGLVQSYNVATARLGLLLGVDAVVDNLRKLGLEQSPQPYPSLLLGALELSPLQVAELYQTFAGGGFRTPLRAVREVLTADGQRLSRYGLDVRQELPPTQVYMVNRLMQLVVERGTARVIGRSLPDIHAAGKTGTSDELRDSWFAGFSGSHLAVVWVGRDDNEPAGVTGASGSAPVWLRLFRQIRTRPLVISVPQKVEHVWVDWDNGLRSGPKCDNAVQLPFIIGTAPDETAECRQQSWLRRLF